MLSGCGGNGSVDGKRKGMVRKEKEREILLYLVTPAFPLYRLDLGCDPRPLEQRVDHRVGRHRRGVHALRRPLLRRVHRRRPALLHLHWAGKSWRRVCQVYWYNSE